MTFDLDITLYMVLGSRFSMFIYPNLGGSMTASKSSVIFTQTSVSCKNQLFFVLNTCSRQLSSRRITKRIEYQIYIFICDSMVSYFFTVVSDK